MKWLVFVGLAALSWGAYVVVIDHGRRNFAGPNAAMRAFLFIGLAYCVMAVAIPGLVLAANPDGKGFSMNGAVMSTLAGALGAAGALCIIFALRAGGRPIYVAPLVFAGAPILNTVIAMMWDKSSTWPDPRFFVGLVLAAVGAAMVLMYKPGPARPAAAPPVVQPQR